MVIITMRPDSIRIYSTGFLKDGHPSSYQPLLTGLRFGERQEPASPFHAQCYNDIPKQLILKNLSKKVSLVCLENDQ